MSRFRLPPGTSPGRPSGLMAGALHRGRGMAVPLSPPPPPPPPPPVSAPGLGGGGWMRRGRLKRWWGEGPQPRRTVARDLTARPFLSCPRGFLLSGPALRLQPQARLHATPHAAAFFFAAVAAFAPGPCRRRCPASPEAAHARSRHCGPAQTANTQTARPRGWGGAWTSVCGVRARAGVGLGGPGAESERGASRARTRASGAEEATGRAGGEQENVGEVLRRERELA